MTVARSVADVLDDHLLFEVESIDRMYLNVWQPRLAYGGGVQGFFVSHRAYRYASTALMDPMTKAFVAEIHGFVAARGLELISFPKGQRKDDLAQQFLAKFTQHEGVLFVGRAQEKAGVWRTQRRYDQATGTSYAWLVRSTAFIDFFYFYCVDADFGRLRSSSPTPPTPPSCPSTAISGLNARPRRPRSGSDRWTTGSPRARTCPRCRRSATASARPHRRPAAQVAADPAPPVLARRRQRPTTATSCRSCGRVLADRDARPLDLRTDLLRAGPARQPRHRSPRPVSLIFD